MTEFSPEKGLSSAEITARVEAILAKATLAEKVGMMSGQGFFAAIKADEGVWAARPYRAGGGIERLGVPAFWFTDGPRGVARGQSTCFPCTMARGASFDVDLERRIGEAMGIEIRAQGCNLNGAVCVNLLRHPAWGRAQETYGEDPCHLGAMGASLGRGIQAHNVCATVKHYALNSIENTRFKVDVTIDERSLHEIYLPHFRTILDAGIASVMSSYNKVNGEYAGQNHHLLTDVLRGEWGFSGFVHSDWVMGVYKPYAAAAGLDVENPEPLVFGEKLVAAVKAGTVAPAVIDTACRRILTTLYRFECAEDPLPEYPLSLVSSLAHIALAREAAEKSAVLLTNDGTLPMDRSRLTRLAVLGRLATLENTGDNGSSRVRPLYIVTALAGLQKALGVDRIVTGDESNLNVAQAAAASADAVVIVVGYTAEQEGEFIPGDITLGQENNLDDTDLPEAIRENRKRRAFSVGGDRIDLGLPADQQALIAAASEAGKPLIIVLVAGSAVMVEGWHDKANAILQTFYSGMEGGTALASLLLGDVSPAGRLPFTVARDDGDYPWFDRSATAIIYDYWHGYAKLANEGKTARFPFGHGLSYSHFITRALSLHQRGDAVMAEVSVMNTGERAADHVVLLWADAPGAIAPCWPRRLVAFARTSLEAGESRIISLDFSTASLRHRNPTTHCWQLEPGQWRFFVAETAESAQAQTVILDL